MEGGEPRAEECIASNVRDRGWQVERGELRVQNASSPMCVTEAGRWSEVSSEQQNAPSPMCVTEAGRSSEVSFELRMHRSNVCDRGWQMEGGELRVGMRCLQCV